SHSSDSSSTTSRETKSSGVSACPEKSSPQSPKPGGRSQHIAHARIATTKPCFHHSAYPGPPRASGGNPDPPAGLLTAKPHLQFHQRPRIILHLLHGPLHY